MIIDCIAIDDEPLALEKMENYISRVDSLNLVKTFSNAVEAFSYMKQQSVDLIFLDIQMDELSGIQFLEALHDPPVVILTTAYDEYALKGYELDVCDYLLKPISFERFLKAVDKAVKQVKQSASGKQLGESGLDETIFIKSDYRLYKLHLRDILYIEGMSDYSKIYTEKERIISIFNLKKMENKLPSDHFFRIHKSYIVPFEQIDVIGKNDVQIGEKTIPIGAHYKEHFFKHVRELQ